jgi:hypothetical protein
MKTKENRKNLLQFGEEVAGYNVPVLNEREIRAAAGILFLVMFMALMFVLFKQDFFLIKYVVAGFFTDFVIRVLINPRFSPTMILGRLIVSRQIPEYVGAPQKKFAWTIGLILSGLMFFLLVLLNSYSMITGFTCLLCLTFLFFETAFGICIGCLVYRLFNSDRAHHCAGEICEQNKKHAIQKISSGQLLTLSLYILLILLAVFFFNDYFIDKPRKLWEIVTIRKVADDFSSKRINTFKWEDIHVRENGTSYSLNTNARKQAFKYELPVI